MTDYRVDASEVQFPDEELPAWLHFWEKLVEMSFSTAYFLLISCFAVGIDLGLRWFERLPIVKCYGLSSVIKWEIELMAYTLATVDCFLFMRKLIQPVVEFIVRLIKR